MLDVIKVERDEDLIAAEAPAFCVIGTAHGCAYGRKITTYTIMLNTTLADFLTTPERPFTRAHAEADVLRLLFGDQIGSRQVIRADEAGHVALVIRES